MEPSGGMKPSFGAKARDKVEHSLVKVRLQALLRWALLLQPMVFSPVSLDAC